MSVRGWAVHFILSCTYPACLEAVTAVAKRSADKTTPMSDEVADANSALQDASALGS